MTAEELYPILDEIGITFKPLGEHQKEVYLQHLKRYEKREMERAAHTIIETHRWGRFPFIAEIRDILDRIRFDNKMRPAAAEKADPYDQYPCSACGGTGQILIDNKTYQPGQSAAVSAPCQCARGQRVKIAREKYFADKRRRKQDSFERRFEMEQE